MTNVIKFCKIFYQNAKLSGTYGFFPTRQPYKRFRPAAIAFWRVSRQRWWIQFGRERLVPTTSALRRRSASFRGLSARKHTHEANIDMLNGMNSLERWQNAVVLILQKRITNRLWSFSASEVTTLSRYTNRFYYYYYYSCRRWRTVRRCASRSTCCKWKRALTYKEISKVVHTHIVAKGLYSKNIQRRFTVSRLLLQNKILKEI